MAIVKDPLMPADGSLALMPADGSLALLAVGDSLAPLQVGSNPLLLPELWIAAFAGGVFGAALGALPALIFTGFLLIAGEAATLTGRAAVEAVGGDPAGLAAVEITGSIAFGPVFGPHVAFAAGAAATAYAAKQGYMDTEFGYFEGKNILYAFGTHRVDVLLVGGAFGVLGMVVRQLSAGIGLPWDPIAFAVVVSAFAHRAAFGYSVFTVAKVGGRFDMTPFEREETDESGRLLVEPWLPHQYEWTGVAVTSFFVGVLGAYIALMTGSPFLGFGISVATLVLLNCGVEKIPVTHHMTLPSSTAALAASATFGGPVVVSLIVGAVFGLAAGLFAEAFQRAVYAHGDTHVDPPAAAIVFGTFLIAIFALLGIFDTSVWVPLP
ncbi:MAG: hypothetical protein ACQETB_03505 [Halobacteriota archaeon]